MQPSNVDFPAPLGPIRHVSEPRSTERKTSSTAVTAPNRFVTPRVSQARPAASAELRSDVGYFENAAPKTALGLHEAMFPAHMLSIWIALWFFGPR